MSNISNTGMVIRQRDPLNLESPFDQLDTFLTPNSLFYVRSHFDTPNISAAAYQLRVDGAVTRPLSICYDQLRAMPSETRVATLECAGNGRIFLVPQTEGAQWQLGAVGNAEWTGVSLRHLLSMAGLQDEASEVVFEGGDRGMPKEKPVPPEPIAYARSLLRAKALSGEVLVAYQMNGEDLPLDHGFPVRLIVPGHYGMASVKWLTRIHAACSVFQGYFQTSDYAYWQHLEGHPVRAPLSKMVIKSQIARPRMYEVLRGGEVYRVTGACWCGESDVEAVEFSSNGGKSWAAVELLDSPQPFAWRRWRYDWEIPERRKRYDLMSRAQDSQGRQQPMQHDPNYGSYVIHHSFAIEVFVQ